MKKGLEELKDIYKEIKELKISSTPKYSSKDYKYKLKKL